MNNPRTLMELRAKKLGILMYDARLSTQKSIEECAEALGVSSKQYRAYEEGQLSPSLPELEAFAFYLKVPLNHFWGQRSLAEIDSGIDEKKSEQLRQIRDRIIGTRLRLARIEQELSLEQLSLRCTLDVSKLKEYEMGNLSIPLPELELITSILSLRIEDFLDESGPVGSWRLQMESFQQFIMLSEEVREFVCKPINKPYLELAMHLSKLPVDKLRTVGESLLEITF